MKYPLGEIGTGCDINNSAKIERKKKNRKE